jgi:hypothetical protein
VDAAGARTSLRELMRAPALLVLDLAGGEPPARHTEALAAAQRRGFVEAYTIAIGGASDAGPVPVLADPALRVHGRLGAVHPGLRVVRPDGYLGLRAEPLDVAVLDAHLALFGL